MVSVFIFLSFFVASVVCSSTMPVVPLTIDNFTFEIKDTPTFVKFHVPWCGHCAKLAPTWEAVAASVHASGAGKVPAFPLPCWRQEPQFARAHALAQALVPVKLMLSLSLCVILVHMCSAVCSLDSRLCRQSLRCDACQHLYNTLFYLQVAEVDCTVDSELCNKYNVFGYPTLLYFSKSGQQVPFQGQRTEEALIEFFTKHLLPDAKS